MVAVGLVWIAYAEFGCLAYYRVGLGAWISLVKFEIWLLFIDYDNVASGQMKDVR